MKRIACILAAIAAATTASAEWVRGPNGIRQWGWPTVLVLEGKTINPATPEDGKAAGYWEETAEEAEALADDNAQAMAEEEAARSLPLMNASGFASINEAGHWVKFVPADTNDVSETLSIQISHSPPDPATARQMEEEAKAKRKAERAEIRAAIENASQNGKVNERLDAIEAALREVLK